MDSIKAVFRTLIIILLAVGAFFVYAYFIPHPRALFKKAGFVLIKKGETVHDAADKLYDLGAISSKSNFVFFSRIFGYDKHIKVGRFSIKPSNSIASIIKMIVRGEQVPFNVLIPEGYTIAQIGRLLSSAIDIDIDSFREMVLDRKLIDSLDIEADDLEGYLAPSTYNLYYNEDPGHVVKKMVSHFFETLPDSFEDKANQLGLTMQEAVALASIVEKEAMLDSERPIIASVYLNRLRKGMRLECDPTVIYALGGIDRRLGHNDLSYQSPYNTYLNYGLPPGPISNPGVASLRAAVNPANSGYLFFVAKGDGSHIFSYNYAEHLAAIRLIRRLGRTG